MTLSQYPDPSTLQFCVPVGETGPLTVLPFFTFPFHTDIWRDFKGLSLRSVITQNLYPVSQTAKIGILKTSFYCSIKFKEEKNEGLMSCTRCHYSPSLLSELVDLVPIPKGTSRKVTDDLTLPFNSCPTYPLRKKYSLSKGSLTRDRL